MPFTPFHFGPGAALKAAAPSSFSFTIFCCSQVGMDLEPGYYILTNQYPVHRFFHTFSGATVVAAACAIVCKPLCQWALGIARELFGDTFGKLLGKSPVISWRTAFITAFIGTFSHVLLDSIMHSDMRPFAPFTDSYPFLLLISSGALHLLCLFLGVAGVLVFAFRESA
jgi:hypothetical protein